MQRRITVEGVLLGTAFGLFLGVGISIFTSEADFSMYTLNSVEQNMTLKDMAYERFTDDYKLRFNDWNSSK